MVYEYDDKMYSKLKDFDTAVEHKRVKKEKMERMVY